MDFDNGTEFLNKAVINWAGERDIYFTRSRPYKKNDQATIESKNNHLVRKYGFYYRYDTSEERARAEPALEARQRPVQLPHPDQETRRLGQDKAGRRKRLYDKPQTPLDRLLAAGALAPAQERELIAYRDQLNPAAIAREIADIQSGLLTGQGQDRAALPRHHPDRPTRRPQGHPDQGRLTPPFAGIPT